MNKQDIKQIKEKYTCLDYLGDRVVKKVANGYLCRAPWREDNHPSLTVTPNGRGWHDLATGLKGSVIDLVMVHHGVNMKGACEILERANPSFSFPQHQSEYGGGREKGAFTRFEVMPLQSRGLFAYLYQRKVNIEIAKQYLLEAHYSTKEPDDGTYIYTLAYPNNLGGYELRNNLRSCGKRSKAPKGITTHMGKDGASVVVFEGFMDMLSFATLCGEVRHNYVVLNSIVNKEAAHQVLANFPGKIHLALDNDKGGDGATSWLMEHLPHAIDIRDKYAGYKDINDYLVSKCRQLTT